MKEHLKHPVTWALGLVLAGCILAFIWQDAAFVFAFVVVAGLVLAVAFVVRSLRQGGDL